MRRRRRKTLDPPPPRKQPKRVVDDPVYIGESPNSMPPPNHLLQFSVSELFPYPLMHAMQHTDTGNAPAFVDGRYEYDYLTYLDKPKLPPTWMDPQLFIAMCRKDPRVQAICARAYKQNRRKPALKALLPLLDEIFTDQYLVYVLKAFESRKEIFTHYLLGNHADKILLRQTREEVKKLRKAGHLARKKRPG
jgi:hypothetical protein